MGLWGNYSSTSLVIGSSSLALRIVNYEITFGRRPLTFKSKDNERTSSNTCVIQDDVMSIKPAPGEGGMKAKPRPNSAHGNRNLKLREAVRKTSNLASAAGELANVSEQLASEFEKENGNMNVFTALKKAINLEGTSQSRVKELSMPGRKKGNFPWNH